MTNGWAKSENNARGRVAERVLFCGYFTQVGADTIITLDASDTIALVNVVPSNLHVGNFHFFRFCKWSERKIV